MVLLAKRKGGKLGGSLPPTGGSSGSTPPLQRHSLHFAVHQQAALLLEHGGRAQPFRARVQLCCVKLTPTQAPLTLQAFSTSTICLPCTGGGVALH